MSDLVERIDRANVGRDYTAHTLLTEARNEIEALRKRVAELEADQICDTWLLKRAEQAEVQLAETQKAVEVALNERMSLRAAMNNELYAVRAQLAVAREALEPFAQLRATRFMTNGLRYEFRIDAAWIRKARAALAQTSPAAAPVGREE